MKTLNTTITIFILIVVFTQWAGTATATLINFELNNLEGDYTLTEGYYPPFEMKNENITTAEDILNITEYTRELNGYFTLPQYESIAGGIESGYLTGRFYIHDSSSSSPSFNYLHVFNLSTSEYHYENSFGTKTDFWVNWDNTRNAYSFSYKQYMSQPEHISWIAGFPSDEISNSLWFYMNYKPGYTLIEGGSVEISEAKISFNTATPVPEPMTITLLGPAIIAFVILRRKFSVRS